MTYEINSQFAEAALQKRWDDIDMYLKQGAYIDHQFEFPSKVESERVTGTALILAVEQGCTDAVKHLLDCGADVNYVCDDMYRWSSGTRSGTALCKAVISQRRDMVELLLDKGADPNIIGDRDCGSALICASSIDLEITRLLLDLGANANTVWSTMGNNGLSPINALCNAVFSRQKDTVELLLNCGANPNIIGSQKYGTAFTMAVALNLEEIMTLLFDRGANVNLVGGTCGTALGVAISSGDLDLVKRLLDWGANVQVKWRDHESKLFRSPLGDAVSSMNRHLVELFLDNGADPNSSHSLQDDRFIYMTVLALAVSLYSTEIIDLLLDRGAAIDARIPLNQRSSRTPGTALGMAVAESRTSWNYNKCVNLVSHLLDRGANINLLWEHHDGTKHEARETLIIPEYGPTCTALGWAAAQDNRDMVKLLLEKGADPNVDYDENYGAALGVAVSRGHVRVAKLLLDRGANIEGVASAKYGSPLAISQLLYCDRSLEREQSTAMTDILLDGGADVNSVGGAYGTVLGAALFAVTRSSSWYNFPDSSTIIDKLLRRGANVNTVAVGCKYGTALGVAIYFRLTDYISFLLNRGASPDDIGGIYGTGLIAAVHTGYVGIIDTFVSRDQGATINAVGGKYGTALGAAVFLGKPHIVQFLLDRGANPNISAGKEGITALGLALLPPHAPGPEDSELDHQLELMTLLVQHGADINRVQDRYGTLLGRAIYWGRPVVVASLLKLGADVEFVGGFYETTTGTFPTAIDACRYWNSTSELVDLVNLHAHSSKAYNTPLSPFPMPISGAALQNVQIASDVDAIPPIHNPQEPGEAEIPPKQARIGCTKLNEDTITQALIALVGISPEASQRLNSWIRRDVRYFVFQEYDFGLAYAAARLAWKRFNDSSTTDDTISVERGLWHWHTGRLSKSRDEAISRNTSGHELIKNPYSIMPRRIWDLKSNRIIDFVMLHAFALVHKHSTTEPSTHGASAVPVPDFWAITHSWTSDMESVMTPINSYGWPVPLPKGISLDGHGDYSVRSELLSLGAQYIWLDVLCLRQRGKEGSSLENDLLQQTEWRLDIPTIGNIFREAQRLVRYFNGLGRKFSLANWDDPRHWLRRAWTLQEIMGENTTLNGGMQQLQDSGNFIMRLVAFHPKLGQLTLRRAMRPILRLAAQIHGPDGCGIYEVTREMAMRYASNPLDKVAGLFYLLRTSQLPCYSTEMGDEDAWLQSFHLLPFARRIEVLFDFPYRASHQRWLPMWKQMLKWPERDPDCDYAPQQWKNHHIAQQMDLQINRFLIPNTWVLSNVTLHTTPDKDEYEVRIENMVFGFYTGYYDHHSINIPKDNKVVLAILQPTASCNWLVGEPVFGEEGAEYLPGGSIRAQEEGTPMVIRKLGVLQTDSSSEILVRGKAGTSLLVKMDCLFV